MLLSPTTTLTSLLAGSSTTSNLCKHPEARAGSEPATKGSKQTEAAPAEPAQALRVALLPHHTFNQAGKGLNSFISQTLSSSKHLITGIFATHCRPLSHSSPSWLYPAKCCRIRGPALHRDLQAHIPIPTLSLCQVRFSICPSTLLSAECPLLAGELCLMPCSLLICFPRPAQNL